MFNPLSISPPKTPEGNIDELRSVPSANDEVSLTAGTDTQKVSDDYLLQSSDATSMQAGTNVNFVDLIICHILQMLPYGKQREKLPLQANLKPLVVHLRRLMM